MSSPDATRRLATALDGLAFLWAAGATLYLMSAADGGGLATVSGSVGGGLGRLGVSLASPDGVWIAALLLLVTITAGLPVGVALTLPDARRPVTWTAAFLLLAFSVIGGRPTGLLYLPCAVVLVVSAAVSAGRGGGTIASTDLPVRR